MASNIPVVFRKSPEFTQTFNWIDNLTGNGYIGFYGGRTPSDMTSYNSDYTTGDDSDADLSAATTWFCQTFTPNGDMWPRLVKVYVRCTSATLALTAYASIRATDVNGKPTGPDLIISDVQDCNFQASNTWVEFQMQGTPPTDVKLNSGTKYALILEFTSITLTKHLYWRYDGSSPTYTGGSYGASTDSGSTWTMDTSKDFMFEILGSGKAIKSLNTQVFASDPRGTGFTGPGIEIDFEGEIKKTCIMDGNALLNFTISTNTTTAATIYFDCEIYKIGADNTETLIGSSRTENFYSNTSNKVKKRFCVLIVLDTTKFSNGDEVRLRLTSRAPWDLPVGSNDAYYLEHSPDGINFIDATDSTLEESPVLVLLLPFKVDA